MTTGVVARSLAATRTYVAGRALIGGGGGDPPPVEDPNAGAPTFTAQPTVDGITQTSAQVSFTSNQFVQAYVRYGLTAGYGSETAHENSFTYQGHVQTISGLTQDTTYHVQAHITNAAAQTADSSPDVTFTTQAQDPVEPPPGPTSPDYGPRSAPSTPVGSYVKTLPGTGGIDLTGAVECAAAVQTWVNANVTNGTSAQHTVFVIPSGSTLKMGTALKFEGRHHITMWAYGATINKVGTLDANGDALGIKLLSTNNWKLLGLTFNGGFATGGTANSNWGQHEQAHGIAGWADTADIETADCVFDKCYGDAIYTSAWSVNIHPRWQIHHNRLSNCGRMCITPNGGGDDWVIENNDLIRPSLSNIDYEDYTGPPQTRNRQTIRNNRFDGWMCFNDTIYGMTPAFALFMQSSEITQPMDEFVFDNNLFKTGWLGSAGPSGGSACPSGMAIIDMADRWAGNSHCGGTPSKTDWYIRGNVFDTSIPIGNGGLCNGQTSQRRLALKIANCDRVTITNNDFRNMVIDTAAYTSPANSSCGSYSNPACTNVTMSGNTAS